MRGFLRFSPGGKYLLTGGDISNSLISLRKTAANQEVMAIPMRFGPDVAGGFPAAFAPDGSMLAVAEGVWRPTDEPRVHVYEPSSGRELFTLKGYKGQAVALAISPDGKTLAMATGQAFPPAPQAPTHPRCCCGKSAKTRSLSQ